MVKIRFDGKFQIEPSNNCAYDYIEIRDGPHGYSPLIGRYCGTIPPMDITSTGRELWLRFNSDESIELNGFRAFFEFKPVQHVYYVNDPNLNNKNKLLGLKTTKKFIFCHTYE